MKKSEAMKVLKDTLEFAKEDRATELYKEMWEYFDGKIAGLNTAIMVVNCIEEIDDEV